MYVCNIYAWIDYRVFVSVFFFGLKSHPTPLRPASDGAPPRGPPHPSLSGPQGPPLPPDSRPQLAPGLVHTQHGTGRLESKARYDAVEIPNKGALDQHTSKKMSTDSYFSICQFLPARIKVRIRVQILMCNQVCNNLGSCDPG